MLSARQLVKGVRRPDKAARFTKDKLKEARLKLEQEWQRTRLDPQKPYIDRFRNNDEYLLVVLDACRYDFFADQVSRHFDRYGGYGPVFSAARDTFEWGQKVWQRDMGTVDVTYVSGAVPINDVELQVHGDDAFNDLYNGYRPGDNIREIWNAWHTGWMDEHGTVDPVHVRRRAVEACRERDRVVAHFFQPHAPYIDSSDELKCTGAEHRPNQGRPNDAPVWEAARNGELSDVSLRSLYRQNLDRAFRQVAKLVDCVDDRPVAVTADHGEALGEDNCYGHERRPHWSRRVVPWLRLR